MYNNEYYCTCNACQGTLQQFHTRTVRRHFVKNNNGKQVRPKLSMCVVVVLTVIVSSSLVVVMTTLNGVGGESEIFSLILSPPSSHPTTTTQFRPITIISVFCVPSLLRPTGIRPHQHAPPVRTGDSFTLTARIENSSARKSYLFICKFMSIFDKI